MPYREPDPTDPSMLVGNEVECSMVELNEMATAFAAELAQMGHGTERIMTWFRQPSFAGPYLAWSSLGEEKIRALVGEAVDFWSRCSVVVREPLLQIEPQRTDSGRE